jgi:hypothetical protein
MLVTTITIQGLTPGRRVAVAIGIAPSEFAVVLVPDGAAPGYPLTARLEPVSLRGIDLG